MSLLSVASLLLAASARALSAYDYVEVVKVFADSFLSPHNAEIAATINSTLFAEDVTGTVDLSADFDGRELSTEYLFGLFANVAKDPMDPSPLGDPISYNVTALAVEHNTVAASVKFKFYYAALDMSFPIQVDAWFYINEQRQIEQYDAAFRRWAWASDIIVPMLIPHMAVRAGLGSNVTNSTEILQEYLAQKVCNASTTYCTGDNQQYDSHDDCMTFLKSIPIGQFYRMGEDNLSCRHLHVGMVPLRPSVHCPHIGPTGGDMCIPRDYSQVVLESHFPAGFLAPKYVTPENKALVGGFSATNGSALSSLLEISLSAQDEHSWDPTLYATALFGYLLFYYVVAKVLWFTYFRASQVFPQLPLDHQKNVIIYTMNVGFTAIALALQLASTPAIAGTYTLWGLYCLRTAGVIVSSIYCFELIYRLTMRIPMILHHFLTIAAISFTVTVFEYTQSMTFFVSAIIWLFQATTEQMTFLGLLGYRMEWRPGLVSGLLKFAAIQSLITKSASAIALLVYWGFNQRHSYRAIDTVWTVLLWVIAIGLLLTQLWGSYVTYTIGTRVGLSRRSPGPPRMSQSTLETYKALAKHKPTSSTASFQMSTVSSPTSPAAAPQFGFPWSNRRHGKHSRRQSASPFTTLGSQPRAHDLNPPYPSHIVPDTLQSHDHDHDHKSPIELSPLEQVPPSPRHVPLPLSPGSSPTPDDFHPERPAFPQPMATSHSMSSAHSGSTQGTPNFSRPRYYTPQGAYTLSRAPSQTPSNDDPRRAKRLSMDTILSRVGRESVHSPVEEQYPSLSSDGHSRPASRPTSWGQDHRLAPAAAGTSTGRLEFPWSAAQARVSEDAEGEERARRASKSSNTPEHSRRSSAGTMGTMGMDEFGKTW